MPRHEEDTAPRIVVGFDGSPHADEALAWGVRQARLTGAQVEVVMAVEVPRTLYEAVRFDPFEGAAKVLNAGIDRAVGPDDEVTVVPRILSRDPANALLDLAEGADLLVVGSRGLGTFEGALLGSVSRRCAQHAPCPVVVIRSDGPEAEGGTASARETDRDGRS
ncbi:universal stress protein [Streptomyces griseus]|uniref:universal stress protein n=1 Tax=Streptomyces griseus TaxID=1911 RepID=UPI00068F71BD|nr:universal stress protein [Streptomyces griseus]